MDPVGTHPVDDGRSCKDRRQRDQVEGLGYDEDFPGCSVCHPFAGERNGDQRQHPGGALRVE
jgi:hypothetical protein